MKLITTLTTILFLSTTYACPDLTGRYHCPDEGEGRDFEITQKQEPENGTTTYLFKYDDGNLREFIEGIVDITIRPGDIFSIAIVSCEDQKLISRRKFLQPEDSWGFDEEETIYSKENDSLLKSTILKLNDQTVESTNTYCPQIGKIRRP